VTPEIDEQIAREWPQRWAKANEPRPGASKRRNNLRKCWKYAQEIACFRAANPTARCETCRNWQPVPHSKKAERHCSVQSDFYGYQITKPDAVCTYWKSHDQ
jgi:hypothetical protein